MDEEADLGMLPEPGSSNSRGKHSGGGGEGDVGSNGWSRRASPEVKADLPHLSQLEGNGDGKVNGEAVKDARSDGDDGLTLREKVERREAAARAQAMAAAG